MRNEGQKWKKAQEEDGKQVHQNYTGKSNNLRVKDSSPWISLARQLEFDQKKKIG